MPHNNQMNKETPQATGGRGKHRNTAKIPGEHRKKTPHRHQENTGNSRIWKPHTCVSWFELDDLHPDAVTSAAMEYFRKNCFEFFFLSILLPNPFAYLEEIGVEDALLTLVSNIYKDLERTNHLVNVVYVDFSRALNIIQAHLLVDKLILV